MVNSARAANDVALRASGDAIAQRVMFKAASSDGYCQVPWLANTLRSGPTGDGFPGVDGSYRCRGCGVGSRAPAVGSVTSNQANKAVQLI